MEPVLAWLDFNSAERERTQRVLALFEEREARDELGLGGIRDSLSDHLFPGTSTIQTRLRYLFFIPWIYQALANKRIPAREIAARARRMELDLTQPLLEVHGPEAGVFGRIAKERLKRLPSSVYWAALRQYDFCRYPGSRDDFHRDFENLWRRRQRSREESDGSRELLDNVWHPKLPEPRDDFPEHPTFFLTRAEAEFFKHCLEARCPNTLLKHLAWECAPVDINFPWEHPDYATFSEHHRELLDHSRLFSETMHGAAILYNWMLAEVFPLKEKVAQYETMFAEWTKEMAAARFRIQAWNVDRFWTIAKYPSHGISINSKRFVETWIGLLLHHGAALRRAEEARQLVRERETDLKKGRSRFNNRRALEQWGGAAGLGRIAFRWASADQFLRDLWEGLQRK
jgi:Family of unknown function (DUF6361)